jgi:hypothetical protein
MSILTDQEILDLRREASKRHGRDGLLSLAAVRSPQPVPVQQPEPEPMPEPEPYPQTGLPAEQPKPRKGPPNRSQYDRRGRDRQPDS